MTAGRTMSVGAESGRGVISTVEGRGLSVCRRSGRLRLSSILHNRHYAPNGPYQNLNIRAPSPRSASPGLGQATSHDAAAEQMKALALRA